MKENVVKLTQFADTLPEQQKKKLEDYKDYSFAQRMMPDFYDTMLTHSDHPGLKYIHTQSLMQLSRLAKSNMVDLPEATKFFRQSPDHSRLGITLIAKALESIQSGDHRWGVTQSSILSTMLCGPSKKKLIIDNAIRKGFIYKTEAFWNRNERILLASELTMTSYLSSCVEAFRISQEFDLRGNIENILDYPDRGDLMIRLDAILTPTQKKKMSQRWADQIKDGAVKNQG